MCNIALVGHRACGKTTIGRKLAQLIGKQFIDLDELIESTCGKSIYDIFKYDGESKFREVEENIISNLPDDDFVVATGGGVVNNKRIMDTLKQKTKLVFIEVEKEELLKRRLTSSDTRPLLFESRNVVEEVEKNFSVRNKLYAYYADIVVKGKDEEIIAKLRESLLKK
jgi:shikimate kinase